ncbi:MAG: sulfopyruvate decarboxylase subunit beta [Thermomicrobiales bacterium]|nr:sulfopyruvate decarboxylase subunit beta [Thermomicrobiales bacterium]
MSSELRAPGFEPSGASAIEQRMRRADALAAIYPTLARDDVVVVTIMGAVAAELYSLGHRPGFFYLQHAMGLASSLGLGLALSLPHSPVVVIDGDGSLLMNLGTLSTMARYRPGNLTHVVFDNESLLSVGGFPTATSTGTDLAGIAQAAGVPVVRRTDSVDAFAAAFDEAFAGGELTTILAKVEAAGPKSFHMDLPMLENRFQFRRQCRALAARAQLDKS